VQSTRRDVRAVAVAMCLVAGLMGTLGAFLLFVEGYRPLIEAELTAGRPDEAFIVTYLVPLLTDLAIAGGVLWLLAAYGFASAAGWAVSLAVVANVLSLLAGFFPMIPAMSRGVIPSYALLFVPNLIFYFVLLGYVRPTQRGVLVLSFLSGIAYVLCFMNGVASIDKIIVTHRPLFIPVQQMSWLSSAAWGLFTVALLLRRPWVRELGLGAGAAATISGFPLAVSTTLELGRFSMFSPAPLLSLALLVYLLTRSGRQMIAAWAG